MQEVDYELFKACQWGGVEQIEALLGRGADIDARYDGSGALSLDKGETPLMFACCQGRLAAVKFLLSANADPDLISVLGRSALYYCTEYLPDEGIAGALIDAGSSLVVAREAAVDNPGVARWLLSLVEREEMRQLARSGKNEDSSLAL